MAPRKSITQLQRQTAAAAELIALCQTVTEDGHLSADEITALQQWLDEHRSSDLPAIEFLSKIVAHVLADGRVTTEEQRELYLAIETVLPPDIRASVRGTRVSREHNAKEQDKHAREGEKIARREARERNTPVDRWDFMVAGCRYEGRPDVIARHCSVQDIAYLCRDRANRYSRNAVEVRLSNGMQAGYVPEQLAIEIAPLLDSGHKHRAYVKKILGGGRVPIPVIIADLFIADCDMVDAVVEDEVPAAQRPLSLPPAAQPAAAQRRARWGCVVAIVAALAASAAAAATVALCPQAVPGRGRNSSA